MSPQETAGSTDRQIPAAPNDFVLPDPTTTAKSIKNAKHVGFLLLGYGGAGHQGGFLSDVILVAYFDVEKQKLALIHIPRDIWVNITVGDTTIPTKINGALALGTKSGNYPTKDLPTDSVLRGSYLSKIAVKEVTGLDIDFVISVDFSSFQKAIDSIKGVDVHVGTAFEDSWYPVKGRELELCGHSPEDVTAMSATMSGFNLEKQFPCRYEHLIFNKGTNHMDGEIALKFVRSRHSSSDFARGERQTELLLAVKDKLFTLKALDRIPEFFTSLSKFVKTDLSIETITDFSPVLLKLADFQVERIGLNTTNVLTLSTSQSGASILKPKSGDNWTDAHKHIQNQLNKL
jgi:anionic cell wall polymer biosynthesis LytR-Cps2A-Psr (LCP) family protein